MTSNPLQRLVTPRFPSSAIGLDNGSASVVQLERSRSGFGLKRGATIAFADGLVRPSFDEPNITDINELADALTELVTSAGLMRRRNWSVALPERATRSMILGLESEVPSKRELDDVLRWKSERGFGFPVEELRVARERIPSDAEGRGRYMATAIHLSVLEQYESVFSRLGWRAGLIVPRHMGEARWLIRQKGTGDSLLISSHREGFTALLVRDQHQLILRSVACDAEDWSDELYRLLLFYRDRTALPENGASAGIERLLIVGENGSEKGPILQIVNDTLGTSLCALDANDLGLALPNREIRFDAVAAPAGLATLAWA